MNNIAIIPARGGSKRIYRKNIKNFFGKPIISYSIEKAIASNLFDKIVVSTDCDEIAEIAVKYGALALKRPPELADDYTDLASVLIHAEAEVTKNSSPEYLCCIYATAPLLAIDMLRKGLQALLLDKSKTYALSVAELPYPVVRSFTITASGGLSMLFENQYLARSQDLGRVFFDAAQFIWWKKNTLNHDTIIFSQDCAPIEIPIQLVQDVDNSNDWMILEKKYKLLKDNYYHKHCSMNHVFESIEQIRLKNNSSTIEILRMAFQHNADEASGLLLKVNQIDKKISNLLEKLAERKTSYNEVLNCLEILRSQNNTNWMQLYKLAKGYDNEGYSQTIKNCESYANQISELDQLL